MIPAVHMDEAGRKTASIQVITDEKSWCVPYSGSQFSAQTEILRIQIGECIFFERGMELSIHVDGLELDGRIIFTSLHPLKYPIMGPFQLIPNMECIHSIISMKHGLKGQLVLNDKQFDFSGGIGYIESDRGNSFPSSYLWAQDIWENGSFMLSIAEIPLGRLNFTGCIGVVFLDGREYRIATYLGAKVKRWSSGYAEIHQGRYRLEVEVLNQHDQPLKAPSAGAMNRTIHESVSSELRIRYKKGDRILMERLTYCAGFEYAGNKSK